MNKIWKEFVFGGHLFGLGAACVVAMCCMVFGISVSWDLLVVAYFIFYPIYLYDYTQGASHDLMTNVARASYLNGNKKVLGVIVVSSFIITTLIMKFSNIETLMLSYVTLILGFMYGSHFKKITKKVVGFKNFFVAAVWGLMVPFVYFYYGISLDLGVILLAGFIFVRMVGIQILFDVRDVEGDKISGLKTIPVTLGKGREFRFMKMLNVLSVAGIIIAVLLKILPMTALGFMFVILYTNWYIERVRSEIGNYKNYLLGAGETIVWFALILACV